jgi:hypothetical protein
MAHRQRQTEKPSREERALAKIDRRLSDARLEVEWRTRQLAKANADVAALEGRRTELAGGTEPRLPAASAAASSTTARTGRPATRSRARRSPRSGSTGGTAGGG